MHEDGADLDPEQQYLVERYYTEFTLAGAGLSDDDKQKLKELNGQLSTLQTRVRAGAARRHQRAGAGRGRRRRARRAHGRGDLRGGRRGRGARARRQARPHPPAADRPSLPGIAHQPGDEAPPLGGAARPRQPRQRPRHPRHPPADGAPARRAGRPARLRQPCRGRDHRQHRRLDPGGARPDGADVTRGGRATREPSRRRSSGRPGTRSRPGTGPTSPSACASRRTTSTWPRCGPTSRPNGCSSDGVFFAASQLFGITFTERTDLVAYHPDVRVFEVREEDGSPVGLYLLDLYTRDSKNGGAWMNSLVDQSTLLDMPTADRGQQPQRLEAGRGRAHPADLRRDDHAVPRVRPRAARPARPRDLPQAGRHQRLPRLRRVPQPGQRDVDAVAGGAGQLRHARRDRRAAAERRRRPPEGGEDVQRGLRHDRVPRGHPARPGLARAGSGRPRSTTSRSSRRRRWRRSAWTSRQSRRATRRRTSPTSSPAATARATTPTSGARCSTPTRSTGSRRTAA